MVVGSSVGLAVAGPFPVPSLVNGGAPGNGAVGFSGVISGKSEGNGVTVGRTEGCDSAETEVLTEGVGTSVVSNVSIAIEGKAGIENVGNAVSEGSGVIFAR